MNAVYFVKWTEIPDSFVPLRGTQNDGWDFWVACSIQNKINSYLINYMENKTQIIDGKALAEEIKQQLRQEITEKNIKPGLAVVLVGDDPASQIYLKIKKKACEQIGFDFHSYILDKNTDDEEVINTIEFLNNDPHIDGLIVQLPLPKNFNTDKILRSISPDKDADCLNPINVNKILNNETAVVSPLVQGVINLLEATGEKLAGKKACLVLKNDILNKTLGHLLKQKKIKTELIKPDAKNLSEQTKKADILITAVGQPFFIKKEMVKEGAILIDIGTNKLDDNVIVGDVDYSEVFPLCSHITPVPGGVGPMTVAMLLSNVLSLHRQKI